MVSFAHNSPPRGLLAFLKSHRSTNLIRCAPWKKIGRKLSTFWCDEWAPPNIFSELAAASPLHSLDQPWLTSCCQTARDSSVRYIAFDTHPRRIFCGVGPFIFVEIWIFYELDCGGTKTLFVNSCLWSFIFFLICDGWICFFLPAWLFKGVFFVSLQKNSWGDPRTML